MANTGTQHYTVAHNSTQRHTVANSGTQWHKAAQRGKQQHTAAYISTQRHTLTNSSKERQRATNTGKQRQTTANTGKHRQTPANTGKQQQTSRTGRQTVAHSPTQGYIRVFHSPIFVSNIFSKYLIWLPGPQGLQKHKNLCCQTCIKVPTELMSVSHYSYITALRGQVLCNPNT